jgi:hypothetical protein
MTRFDVRRYKFWFVDLLDRLGVGWLTGALLVASTPFVLGLVLVAPFGRAGLYVRTPAFYIGFGGIALVMAAAVRGVEVLAAGLSDLQEVAADPQEFHDFVDEQLRIAARDRSNIGLLAVVFAGAAAVVAVALKRWSDSGVVPAGHGFRAFLVEWRAPGALVPVGLALCVFAVTVALTFGTSAILLGRNLLFAWRLRNFRYVAFPGRVRLAIRRLITAYAWASGTWAIGVALFALFFFGNWSVLNVIGIALLAVLGVLTLAIPYSSFRKILDNTHDEMSDCLMKQAEPIDLDTDTPDEAARFATINAAITTDPPPVLTRRGAIAYGAVQLVAIGSIFAKDFLQEQVTFLAKSPSDETTSSKRPHEKHQ